MGEAMPYCNDLERDYYEYLKHDEDVDKEVSYL